MGKPDESIDTIRSEGYEGLADGDPAKILFRTNTSININLAGELFPRLVQSAPEAEGGCWWDTLESYWFARNCMYSKAGSAAFEEFDDTICTTGETAKIYLCNRYEEEDPVVQLLLELYHKTPFDVYGKPEEPEAGWDCAAWYDALPRTFKYARKTYCYDDGRVEEACGSESFDEYGYMEYDGGECHYYDEDEGDNYYPEDFKDGIILRWVCGKSRKEWVPGKLNGVSAINGHCYYLDT